MPAPLFPSSALPNAVQRESAPVPEGGSNHSLVRRSLAYRMRLPLTAICVLTGITFAMVSRPAFPPGSTAGIAAFATGALFVAAGIALRLWALACISERKTKELVTTGPYSLCRNPLYLGTLSIAVGFAAMWLNGILILLLLPPIALYCAGVVPAEERVLRQTFGAEYDTYCRRTARWVPNFSAYVGGSVHWRSKGVHDESQSGLWWLGLAALSCWLTCLRAGASWLLF